MFWIIFAFLPASFGNTIVCPGGSYQCPDSASCCELPDKTYGCCPLRNAVCCDDHIHCCPMNSKCDAGMCIQNSYENRTADKVRVWTGNHCSSEECPDHYTCCSDPNVGIHFCCPLPDAVCCTDGLHCCPQNGVCDLKSERCVHNGFVSLMYESKKEQYKTPNSQIAQMANIAIKAKSVSNVICPGEEFQCPDGYSCCKLPSGNWGCCPFVNATCCSDHLHCCPQDLKCDSTSQSCIQGLKNVTWFENKPAEEILDRDIICPDKHHCSEHMTCCKLNSGNYSCCPYVDAVCCSDHLHCCPQGYECDLVKKRCLLKQNWVFKFLSKYRSFLVNNV